MNAWRVFLCWNIIHEVTLRGTTADNAKPLPTVLLCHLPHHVFDKWSPQEAELTFSGYLWKNMAAAPLQEFFLSHFVAMLQHSLIYKPLRVATRVATKWILVFYTHFWDTFEGKPPLIITLIHPFQTNAELFPDLSGKMSEYERTLATFQECG